MWCGVEMPPLLQITLVSFLTQSFVFFCTQPLLPGPVRDGGSLQQNYYNCWEHLEYVQWKVNYFIDRKTISNNELRKGSQRSSTASKDIESSLKAPCRIAISGTGWFFFPRLGRLYVFYSTLCYPSVIPS